MWAHHVDAKSKASSSGSTGRKRSSQPHHRWRMRRQWLWPFPHPPHPYSHIDIHPEFQICPSVFSCAQYRSRRGRGEMHKAEPGPIWLLASQSLRLVSLPCDLNTAWVTQKRFLWPVPLFVFQRCCQETGRFLTLFPHQYCRGPSYSLVHTKTLSFLSLFSPSKVEGPKRQETHLFLLPPLIIASAVLCK